MGPVRNCCATVLMPVKLNPVVTLHAGSVLAQLAEVVAVAVPVATLMVCVAAPTMLVGAVPPLAKTTIRSCQLPSI